ncbi:MAG: malto-oligosyltrehalose synthase [Nitrosomonas sp.]|nr:MAG: malto-oligosyltrehalose synthase [Nitrosomonas sp.]
MNPADDEWALLARLSELAGILPVYTDNWLQPHCTQPQSQRKLLTAMGFDVSTPQRIASAIKAHELQPWQRILEPVTVTTQDQPPWVPVTLPGDLAGGIWTWRLHLENHEILQGQFSSAALPKLAATKIAKIRYTRRRLDLPPQLPCGYHRLELSQAAETCATQTLIIAPVTCYQPQAISAEGRVWGLAVQLYAVRSERHWGIGDFTDLRLILEQWAAQDADIIGINPVHAMFPYNPEHASPYSPSSRLFLNVFYLDVEAVSDFHECEEARAILRTPEFQIRLEGLRATGLVDYAGVAALKLPLLEMLFEHFCAHHVRPDSERAREFRAFQSREGDDLYQHALFEALQEHFHRQDPAVWGWPVWPEPYRNPQSSEVRQFAESHPGRIEFFAYLQWQADLQLAGVGLRSLELGLGIGLYLDLAISVDGGGAESWANQALYASGASIGAPPELNNQLGQDWGLPPFLPARLRETAYAAFIRVLRHNMRHAGALRIDHVMGLMRQYWIPAGCTAAEGAYVQFPFDDLLGILALESQRNQCLVIGEDLGTVPEEVTAALPQRGILSYRLLILEKEPGGNFIAPENYPAQALTAVTTHDLPTLPGYWAGRDIMQRSELQLFSSGEARRAQVVERAQERAYLLLRLEQAGLLPDGLTVNPISLPFASPEFIQAVYSYLARSPAKILMAQIDDILEVPDQINIPSTTTQHPNWRRKLPICLETCAADRRVQTFTVAMRLERPRIRHNPKPERCLRIPLATYRLQLNQAFTFTQAAQIVPYLAQLGISHVYCSPYLKARPGSTHGYDIVDHHLLNPEIGAREAFDTFCAVLHAHGMGQIMDLVPNHMGVMGADNHWWLDVLENGPASIYASFFDIDWHPLKTELRNKVLLPILGQSYGDALENGQLTLQFDETNGSFSVWYFQHRLPVAPHEYCRLLRHRLPLLEGQLRPDHPDLQEFTSLITAFTNLPSGDPAAPGKIIERHRDQELLKRRLSVLISTSPPIRQMILDVVSDYNGTPDHPASSSLLHELLEAQSWRVANWRVASDEINYRRFFDINDLAALRMEDGHVFEATHQLVLELIAEGKVDGLRIDHPDGLYDPPQYFQRLQDRVAIRSPAQAGEQPIYLVVEKILAEHESLREDWPIHGTTGYEFCRLTNGLFIDPEAKTMLNRTYRAFTRTQIDFDELVYRCKHQIMKHAMASELNVLAGQLSHICELRPHTRDFTTNHLRHALAEVIAYLPVYRTFIRNGQTAALDRRYVEWAVAIAKKRAQIQDISIYDFISSVLLLDAAKDADASYQDAITAFAMKFQQVSSPVMAKGCEDTAFYLYHRLISLNEVGSDPRHFGTSVKAFHAENLKRLERWPHAMLNTSTHDSKRSEDVRMRINVLSEIPGHWHLQARRWRRLNRSKKRLVEHKEIPSTNDEYLLYQTMLGIWPLATLTADEHGALLARLEAYMIKAVREAKQHSSWFSPDAVYEEGLLNFIGQITNAAEKNVFLADFIDFNRHIAHCGLFNSLSQTLLKLSVPGVPDIYQGNELWGFNLVDPDNRRPVDYSQRQQLLERIKESVAVPQIRLASAVREFLDDCADGRAKLYLTWQLLQIRKQWPEVFQNGAYVPLPASGEHKEHICAFMRQIEAINLIIIAPRWFSRLLTTANKKYPLNEAVWGNATWIEIAQPVAMVKNHGLNLLTGETIALTEINGTLALAAADALMSFPVALIRV